MTGPSAGASTQVVVVGGGISGLVVALDLARAGHRPIVLEAGGTCGGVVSAHRVGGLVLDAGAESFGTARPAVAELLGELGLADRITAPNPAGAWVRHRAGTAPLPASGLLGIPGHPLARDVRRVVGWPGVVRALADTALPARAAPSAGTTVGAVVRSRMGVRVLDRLVEPVAGGVYATDPDLLELDMVAPGIGPAMVEAGSLSGAVRLLRGGGERPGSAVAGLSGGLHTLVDPLITAVLAAGGTVSTGATVTGLARHGSGWRVTLADGSVLGAMAVVLAVPAPVAARLLAVAPDVSTAALQAPIAPVLICTLVVDDARLDRAPRGTGVLVSAHATGVQAKALTHATTKWPWLAQLAGPGRHVLRLSYGRGEALPSGSQPSEGQPPESRSARKPRPGRQPSGRRPPEELPPSDLPGNDLPDGDLPGNDLAADVAELAAVALADAAELLGVELSPASVVDAAVVRWDSALPAPRPGHLTAVRALRADLGPLGLSVVGACVAGSGLAGVVADARPQAARLAARLGAVAGLAPVPAPAPADPGRR